MERRTSSSKHGIVAPVGIKDFAVRLKKTLNVKGSLYNIPFLEQDVYNSWKSTGILKPFWKYTGKIQ